MNKSLLVLVALVTSICLNAQSSYDEVFQLSYEYLNPAGYDSTSTLLSKQQASISGGYGFELNDNGDALNVGLGYQWFEMDTDSMNHQPLHIHNTAIGAEWLRNWKNPSWASTVSAGIAVVSDYKVDLNSAYQTSLTAAIHYGKTNDLIWTFGVFYSDQPFGPWVFPILGVDWRISNRLYFSTILLSHTYLELAVKPNVWYAGLDIRATGNSFVMSEYRDQQASYVTSYSEISPYYPYAITLFNDFYISDFITPFVKAGVLMSRENKHFTEDHEVFENSVFNNRVDPSFYLKAGIALRFRNF